MFLPVMPGLLFDEVDEIGVRDGANLKCEVMICTELFDLDTIEECLNPP